MPARSEHEHAAGAAVRGADSAWLFLLVTVVMGGWAGWMAARGIARGWRPFWQCALALLLVAAAVRFIHYALFSGTLLSLHYYAVDAVVVMIIGAAGFRYTRTRQMTSQYRWLYEKTSPLTWRERAPGAGEVAMSAAGSARAVLTTKGMYAMRSILLAGLALGAMVAAAQAAEVKLGIAAPITGNSAAIGAQLKNGASQAVEDLNKAGTLKGTTLSVTVGDDASDPKQGVSVANKFASDGVKMVVGDYNSGVSIPASDVYLDAGIIQVTPASTNVKFTERGMWNTFRTCGRDDQQGAVAGTYLADALQGQEDRLRPRQDPLRQGPGRRDPEGAQGQGRSRTVMFEGINPGEKDYSALVSKLKSANVDVVYFGGYYTEAGLILRQMRDQGLKAPMMGGDGMVDRELVSIAGPAAEGTLTTFPPDARKNPNAKGALAAFKAKNIDPEGYTLYSYAAVQVLAKAMAETGSSDGKKLADWLHQGKAVDTVVGPIAYDKKGDITRPDYVMYEWKKGADGKIDYSGNELTK